MVKVRKKQKNNDVNEISLLIEKDAQITDWNDQDLINSITEEIEVAENTAKEIALNVKEKIKEVAKSMGWDFVESSLIREFVSNEILSKGKKYKKKANKYNVIGLSPYEIKNIIENKETGNNSNVRKNNPEAIAHNISEIINKKYALQEVFSKNIVEGHYSGKIYLHDLGQINRVYCGSHSIVYVIKYGLNLPTVNSVSLPAKSCEVLIKQISTFLATIASIYSGAVGLASFNTFISPFLVGMNDKEIKQIAQSIIFSFAQTAFGRGAQPLFIDTNLDITVPNFLRETKALGPSGKYYKVENDGQKDYLVEVEEKDAATYYDYQKYMQKLLVAMMEVYETGCAKGTPFSFPKPLCHFNEESFLPENKWIVDSILTCASKNGTPYFLFDRGTGVKVAQCCRLSVELGHEDLETISKNPENSRFAALQNVSINLPHAALLTTKESSKADKKETIENIKEAMDIALKAHKEKFKYIKKLYNIKDGPLDLARNGMIGEKYIDLNSLTYLIGIIGLDECVQIITGKQLHESKEAYKLGVEIIAEMSLYCDKLSKESGLKLVLEETPGESANNKCAINDCNNNDFGELAKKYVKGDYDDGSAYWMNSVHFDYACDVNAIERISKQSSMHNMIKGGSIINLFVGERNIPKETILDLVQKTFKNTDCTQLTISPEFTICNECSKTYIGLNDKCKFCGSEKVLNMTRVVGYYSITNVWSKGKKAELKTRNRKSHANI